MATPTTARAQALPGAPPALTREVEIARAAETEPVNEWNDASLAAEETEEEVIAPQDCPLADVAAASSIGFESCVEASIRGGNSLDESSRVCRAVFPEPATE